MMKVLLPPTRARCSRSVPNEGKQIGDIELNLFGKTIYLEKQSRYFISEQGARERKTVMRAVTAKSKEK